MYYQYGPMLKAFTDIAQKNAEGVLASNSHRDFAGRARRGIR